MGKFFSVRKPRLRFTKKGVKVTPPSARIGGKVGINLSKSGISGSVRGRHASYNTRRGASLGCLLPVLVIVLAALLSTTLLAQTTFPFTAEVVDNANLRAGPDTTYDRIGSVSAGDTVVVVSANADNSWYRLESNAWIAAFLVRRVETTQSAIPAGAVEAQVTRIVDGDTIDVMIAGRSARVRYILMNTPETNQVYGAEATAKNRELVGGKTVYLEKDVSETDRYGRLLRYVYLDDGTMVNRELVRLGFAQVATYPPDVKYEAQIRAAQREAMDAGRGLWAGVSTSTATPRPPTGPTANGNANLRAGPGTNFAVAGSVSSGQALDVVGRTSAGDWYQLRSGVWIAAFLVANAPTVPVAQNIPSTPAPVATRSTSAPAQSPTVRANCDSSYPDVCIPPYPPDLDCGEIPYRRFRVIGTDPHGFDGDNDGIGCER